MKNLKSFFKEQFFLPCISTFLVLFFLICMVAAPSKFINCALDGISAWAFNVLPSVLPFMFFTKILSTLDFMPKLVKPLAPISNKLFKTPPLSMYVFIMAVLSGYPVGAKMVADLYMQGKISKQDAFRMTSFCSTSGPMFIIGAVGIGMFSSAKIGYVLFVSHVLGAILNGILFRKIKIPAETENQNKNVFKNNKGDLGEIVSSSTLAILSVGCIITIFFIVIECFSPIFSLFPKTVSAFLQGVIEITKGCLELSALPSKFLSAVLTSFVVSFGGISTILQSVTMLSKLKMPVKIFVIQKLCHGVFTCFISAVLILVAGV